MWTVERGAFRTERMVCMMDWVDFLGPQKGQFK